MSFSTPSSLEGSLSNLAHANVAEGERALGVLISYNDNDVQMESRVIAAVAVLIAGTVVLTLDEIVLTVDEIVHTADEVVFMADVEPPLTIKSDILTPLSPVFAEICSAQGAQP